MGGMTDLCILERINVVCVLRRMSVGVLMDSV